MSYILSRYQESRGRRDQGHELEGGGRVVESLTLTNGEVIPGWDNELMGKSSMLDVKLGVPVGVMVYMCQLSGVQSGFKGFGILHNS